MDNDPVDSYTQVEILTAAYKQKSAECKELQTKILILVNRVNALDSQCERARNLLNQLIEMDIMDTNTRDKVEKYMEEHYGKGNTDTDTDGSHGSHGSHRVSEEN